MHRQYDVVVLGGIFREIGADPTYSRLEVAGSGLTASAISARLGARTALLASVGHEDLDAATHVLGACDVDRSWLEVTSGASGTFLYPPKADDARPWPMFRPAESAPPTDLAGGLPGASVYLLFGLPELDPVEEGWLDDVPYGSTVLWDRQGWLSRARDWRTVLRVPAGYRVYLANEDEAMAEFEADTMDELLNRLPPDGIDAAVVKRGSAGCVYRIRRFDGVDGEIVSGFPVQSTSTVGTGDVFAGCLAAQLAQGAGLGDAVRMANALAAAFLIEGRDVLAPNLVRLGRSFVGERAGDE